MRTTLLLILIGSATAFAQQFEGADTTNTQAVLRFTGITDAGACRLSITDTAGKLIHDSDPALYPDAQSGLRPGNVLNGSTLYFVVGKRTYELASDNRSYSRALQTATNYSFSLSGCGNDVNGTFTTATIPFGSTRGEALPVASPGVYAYPTINWADQADPIVDAQSGVAYRRMTGPGGGTPVTNVPFFSATGGAWTNVSNVVADDSKYATVSASTDPLYLDWDYVKSPFGAPVFDGVALDYFQLLLKGKASAAADVDVCLSIDQGTTCKSPWNSVHLTTSDATYTVGTTTPIDTLGAVPPISKQQMAANFGTATYEAATKTLRATTASSVGHANRADGFNIDWRPRTKIQLYGATLYIDNITAGTSPEVTTNSPHGYTTGDVINIAGNLGGLTGANGTWIITVTGPNTFTLNGATTSGVYGLKGLIGPANAGSPPTITIPNSFWSGVMRVRFSNFTDPGWSNLNSGIYTLTSVNGSTEIFTIDGASGTGTYTTQWAAVYRLMGVAQKVGVYTIHSVDSPTQITLEDGPATDIPGTQTTGSIHVYSGQAHVCMSDNTHAHGLSVNASITITGASPESFNGTKTVTNTNSGYGAHCFVIGATTEAQNDAQGYVQSGATFSTLAPGYVVGQDYEYHPFGVLIRKSTPSPETVSINYVAANYASSQGIGWPAGGGGFTHRIPVGGYFLGQIGEVNLWGFKADGSEAKWFGDVRMQQNPYFSCYAGGTLDARDPLTYYCQTVIAPYSIVKATLHFDGTDVHGNARLPVKNIPLCSEDNTPPCFGPWIDLVPGGIRALARATDASYWDDLFPVQGNCGMAWGGYVEATDSVHIGLSCGASNQNGGTVWYVLDLGNQIPYGQPGSTMRIIARRDTWSGKNARWTGVHGGGMRGFPEKGYITWSAHPMNNGLFDTGPGTQDWFGPYKTTYSGSPMTSTSWGSCAAFAGNSLLPAVIPTGAGCETRTVQGEPCDDSPGANETARVAAHTSLMATKCGRSNAHYLQDAIVGDLFIHNDGYEVMQLIDKGSDGKTWTFYRGAFYGYFNLGVDKGAANHNNNTIYAWYNTPDHTYSVKSGSAAWDYMADPYPDATHDAVVQQKDFSDGHGWDGWLAEGRSGVASPLCGLYCVGVRTGRIEQRWPMTGFSAAVSLSAPFAGQTGHSIPNEVDSHSTMAQSSDGADNSWWLDGRPMLSAMSPAATSVTGLRYRWAANQGRPLQPKYFDIMAYAGNNPIADISGPGSVLGTGPEDSYKGCFALVAGECDPASQAGDYYINAPGITVSAAQYVCCGQDPSRLRDIGWTNAYAQHHQMTQTLIRDDAAGKYTRNLGRGLLQYRLFDTFYNLTETSDGKTALIRAAGLGGIRNDALSFSLPPIVLDSVNRGTFVPVSIEGTRAAGVRTRVKFGYDRSFACTSRRDACFAVNSEINETNPFLYSIELTAASGVSASSYRIDVPGISGKVMYYQVEDVDDSGSVVRTGPLMVTAVQ